jgi:hypothetical protein
MIAICRFMLRNSTVTFGNSTVTYFIPLLFILQGFFIFLYVSVVLGGVVQALRARPALLKE